jgi:transketolase
MWMVVILMDHKHDDIQICAKLIRQSILQMAFDCNGPAHLGGGLSMVDIMTILYGKFLNFKVDSPRFEGRDRFILSKGHGVLGYFPVLAHFGVFDENLLRTFKSDESDLIAHPVMNLDLGIESSNGSLGHGLSMSVGIALSGKLRNQDFKTFCLLGDGECNEGSVWESVMSAAQYKLDNLVALVDWNGYQSDGSNMNILNNENLHMQWESFGWFVIEIDGHDISEITRAFETAISRRSTPTVILARTIKGKGISFMENNNSWHHNRLTQDLFKLAIEEVSAL